MWETKHLIMLLCTHNTPMPKLSLASAGVGWQGTRVPTIVHLPIPPKLHDLLPQLKVLTAMRAPHVLLGDSPTPPSLSSRLLLPWLHHFIPPPALPY